MERITSEKLRRLALASRDIEVRAILAQAADTIDEMDKDIAVYMTENEQLRRALNEEESA